MPRYTRGELTALVALTDGDVSAAADLIGADADYLQSAIDGRQLPRVIEKEIERGLEDYRDENPEHAEIIERVGGVLNWYPELIEIIDNDGVAEALVENPDFALIFHKDPTVWESDKPLIDKETGEIRVYAENYRGRYGEPGEVIYKKYSGGGLFPGAVDVVVDWATKKADGGERRRQRNLSPMIEALRQDNFDISEIDESAFWEWFRNIYPE